MKFAVGDKVTIKSASKTWSGVRAVVKEHDSEEKMYPYTLTLIDDTSTGSYKSGDTAEAFREDELVAMADVVAADIEKAKQLLQKHGIPFRIYSREDVDKMLNVYEQDPNDPLDTRTFRSEIAAFIMEGQDWKNLSDKGQDDEAAIWDMVEGARNDHPEWFVN
jgi:uncharacterized protein YodC (DUF2158 family)